MANDDGFVFAKPRHGDVSTALLREYTANHNGIGVIYRALDLLVAHFGLDDAALVVDGSDLGVQVFRARRRPLGPEHAWLLGATPGLYAAPKVKFDTSLLLVLCAIALDLDVEHHDAGHDALTDLETGDEALRTFSRALRAEARTTDTVGRWGGDEFVIVALADKAAQLAPLVERIRRRLARSPVADDQVVAFRESVPVMYPADGMEPGEILARALGSLKPN